MFGFKFSESNGLSALNNKGKLLHCTAAGISSYWRAESHNILISHLYIEGRKFKEGTVIAYSDGICRKSQYTKWKLGNSLREGYWGVAISKRSVDNPNYFYVFEPYDGEYVESSDYGLVLKDEVGKVIYNDSLKTLKILGHFSKKNRNPVWYFPDRVKGKDLAYIQLGGDLSAFSNGRLYEERSSVVERGYNSATQSEYIKDIHSKVLIHSGSFIGKFQSLRDSEDILFIIIDVTGIKPEIYPIDYLPPDITSN